MPVRPNRTSSCVYSGGVKAIATENCHVDIFVVIRIYFIGILLWPNVDSNQSSKLNRAYIADAVTEMSYLIIWQTSTRISLAYNCTPGQDWEMGASGRVFFPSTDQRT